MVHQNRKERMLQLPHKAFIGGCVLVFVLCVTAWQRSQHAVASTAPALPKPATLAQLPLRFEANQGQADARVKFLARGQHAQLWLTERAATLQVSERPLTLTWLNAQSPAVIEGLEPLAERSHYFRGADPRQWKRDVPRYARVRYAALYPGVDLIFYDRAQKLEYDFVIAPGHDARRIRWQFSGQQTLKLDATGALVLRLGDDVTVTQPAPVAYQQTAQGRVVIDVRYRLLGRQRVGFTIGAYDRRLPLVIDPVLEYSTLLGGNGADEAYAMRVDRFGNTYLVGRTSSADFPGTGAIQARFGGNADAFVAKVNVAGTELIYATYLGGNALDYATALALDENQNVFVTGATYSDDFPLTTPHKNKGYADAFVARLAANGSLLDYSTAFGGNGFDIPYAIGLQGNGTAVIAGRGDSADLPNAPRLGQPLYRSTDRAATWSASANGLTSFQTNGLAVARSSANTFYAATSQGVFKSTDGGANWQPTSLRNTYCYTVAVDPRDAQVIYAGTDIGLYKSTDGGANFTYVVYWFERINAFNVYHLAYDAAQPAQSSTLYLCTQSGLYRLADSGAGFQYLAATPGRNLIYVNHLAFDPSNRQILYAASALGVTKSLDGGSTWQQLALTPLTLAVQFSTPANQVVIDPRAPNTLYAAVNADDGSLLKSTDGGASWTLASRGLLARPNMESSGIPVHRLAIDPTNSMLYAGNFNGGLWRSSDGGANWNRALNGLNNLLVTALLVEETGRLWAGTIAGSDVLLAQVNAAGAVSGVRMLGGFENDEARALTLDAAGNIYLTGRALSQNFPLRNALQTVNRGASSVQLTADAFVTKLNPAGTEILYSTYLGGNAHDLGSALALDAAGNLVVAGDAASNDFPTTAGAFKAAKLDFNQDAFVARLNAAGTALQFATYLGGSGEDSAAGVALDASGNVYVTGSSRSVDFPAVNGLPLSASAFDAKAFFSKLTANAATLTFSTLLSGNAPSAGAAVAVDEKRNVAVSGSTNSSIFPAFVPLNGNLSVGSSNAFLARFAAQADLAVTSQAAANPVQAAQSYRYTVTVTNLGPDEAVGAVLNDVIPNGLTNVTATASTGANACTISSANLQCRLGEMAVGAVASVTLTGTAPASGTLNQTASVVSNTPDAVGDNQRATLATTVSNAPSIAGSITTNGTANGAPLSDVTLTIRNGLNATKTSNATGAYQFAELTKGASYAVTAARLGYVLRPANFNFDDLQSDQRADFTATACRFTFTANQQAFAAAGGSGTLTITATDPACAWQVRSAAPWLVIGGTGNGAGNGTLSFSVAPTNATRSGFVGLKSQGVTDSHLITLTQEFEACATPSLQIAPSLSVASEVGTELTQGDCNGDGNTDLIWFNARQNSASVSLGDGRGAFSATPRVVTFGPVAFNGFSQIAVGDLNGDGRSDLAALAGSPVELVSVLGNADGTFSALRKVAVPAQTSYFTLARMNGDNRADAVIFNRENSSLQVLLAGSDGSFGAPNAGLRTPQTFFNNVLDGDLNRDGKNDLVMLSSSNIYVYLGDGAGNLITGSTVIFNGNYQRGSVLADFNRDGNLDLALSASGDATGRGLQLFKGNGAGGLGFATSFEGGGRHLLARDVDRDGVLDLVAVPEGTAISFLRNNDDGTFALPVSYHIGVLQPGVVAGDFNRDGRAEFAFPILQSADDGQSAAIAVLASNGAEWRAGRLVRLAVPAALLAVGDFNNDGVSDLLVRTGEHLIVRLGDGANGFPAEVKTPFPTPALSYSTRDYNQDGNLDVIAENGFAVSLWAGDGRGGFLSPRQVPVNPPPSDSNSPTVSLPLAWGDFNRDGRLDFATITSLRQPLLYFAQANGGFSAPQPFGSGLNLTRLLAGDFNGDGRVDLVGYTQDSGLPCTSDAAWVAFFPGGATTLFDPAMRSFLDLAPNRALVEDLNGDGRAELILFGGCGAQGSVGVARWQANGSFTVSARQLIGFQPRAVVVGDLNHDARPDLLLTRPGITLTSQAAPTALVAMTGNSAGGFSAPVTLAASLPVFYDDALGLGDFNGDQRADVLIGGGLFSAQTALTLFNNNCLTVRALGLASAASYASAALAPESIVAAFGADLGLVTSVSRTRPLPDALEGTRVNVIDALGSQRSAGMFFVSPTQVNFLLPAGLAAGTAQVTITSGSGNTARTTARIAAIAPGLFAANANGQGPPAAFLLRVRGDGLQFTEPLARFDSALNRFVAVPIEFGPASDQLFLVLYGTGIRGRTALSAVTGKVGGLDVPILYAGAQPDFLGLDQINLALPRALQGRGEVELQLTVEGQPTNPLRITFR